MIGTQETGLADLSPELIGKIGAARLVIGPGRLADDVSRLPGFSGEIMDWPQPFLDIPLLKARAGEAVVILATGDPLWYGAASTLVATSVLMKCNHACRWGFSWRQAVGWPLHDCLPDCSRAPMKRSSAILPPVHGCSSWRMTAIARRVLPACLIWPDTARRW